MRDNTDIEFCIKKEYVTDYIEARLQELKELEIPVIILPVDEMARWIIFGNDELEQDVYDIIEDIVCVVENGI